MLISGFTVWHSPKRRFSPMRAFIGFTKPKDGAIFIKYTLKEYLFSKGKPKGQLVKWNDEHYEFEPVSASDEGV